MFKTSFSGKEPLNWLFQDQKRVLRGTGTSAYNQKLSKRRAAAVKDYLIKEAGVDSSKITAVGYGQAKPVADNKTAAGRALNRRVEILVLSD